MIQSQILRNSENEVVICDESPNSDSIIKKAKKTLQKPKKISAAAKKVENAKKKSEPRIYS